ncbi:fluoride efflux transporter CrcB [Halobacillus amylolyticus]|uniref:Fluoride-specific ion channel FluC n=1 Tax=Halobacillus amylolyticus TaxID=2932259 RepID=A0ABY4HBI1_9BACI|nr:fluoride efflux transporter CrcB [Halobacillus amylolyticus]UOR11787.1 fluoride efflux transporter CrcB [Halobacillus amylolyticus]
MRSSVYLGIALGGGAGSAIRYWLSEAFNLGGLLPYGTLFANLAGCFLLSFLYQKFLVSALSKTIQKAVTTGFVGSLTTFSTYSVESVRLFEEHLFTGVVYIMLSLVGGLAMTWMGFKVGGGK